MSQRLHSLTDDELGGALSHLDIDWPAEPDLAPRVMAAARARRPNVIRLPLTRPRRVMLIAAAAVLLLAGAAVAARVLIDLGAVVVERTPGPPTSSPAGPRAAFGTPLTLREAEELLGGDVPVPSALGSPARIWADHVFTEAGEVVRITAAWDAGPELPAIEGIEHGAVLMRFEGDVDQAWKELFETTGTMEIAFVDGREAIWTTGRHTIRILTSEGVVYTGVEGNVLLWRDGRYTMRLETALPQAEAVRIAESIGTR